MEHLLQPNEIASYSRPVTRHLDEDTAHVFIAEAEALDIRPAIGDALFKELLQQPDRWPNSFLLEGGWYPSKRADDFAEGYDDSLCDACFKGLKSALAYHTIARLIKGNDAQVTRYGLVQKDMEYSNRPSMSEKNSQYRDIAAIGDSYLRECLAFIKTYKHLFPAVACHEREVRSNRTKFRILGD